MNIQLAENTGYEHAESYLLIKNEYLDMKVISGQILSGSIVTLSSYNNVVFSDCIFYATEFQGVTFRNCIFENCNFEFSHIKNCTFINCSFFNCLWKASTSQKSIYENCDIRGSMDECISQGMNEIKRSCDNYSTDIYIQLAIAC